MKFSTLCFLFSLLFLAQLAGVLVEIYLRNNSFELEYDWYEAVPFMSVRNRGGGMVVLWANVDDC